MAREARALWGDPNAPPDACRSYIDTCNAECTSPVSMVAARAGIAWMARRQRFSLLCGVTSSAVVSIPRGNQRTVSLALAHQSVYIQDRHPLCQEKYKILACRRTRQWETWELGDAGDAGEWRYRARALFGHCARLVVDRGGEGTDGDGKELVGCPERRYNPPKVQKSHDGRGRKLPGKSQIRQLRSPSPRRWAWKLLHNA